MRLEAIEQSKFDAGRCTLVFEDGEKLKTFTSAVADFGLYSGMELADEELQRLKSASNSMSAKARAARIVGAAPVSKSQLVKKLCEKGESEPDAENAADWLEELGAVNDAEYALMLVKNCAARGYGKARIKQKLREKGIDRELWDDALNEYPKENEQIYKFVRARLSPGETDKKAIKKVSDALIRRGFSWNEVSAAIRKALDSDTSEE